jgi:hypothetical protein
MNSAHVWFLVLNWINLIAPTGYWAMWIFLKVDPVNNILPLVTSAMSLITDVTTVIALISSSDPNGDGLEDADDATYVSE